MNFTIDKKIWREFKEGDNKALSHIYHQNVDFLFSYGKKLTFNDQLIIDVIHDLFCYLIEKKSNLGEAENIRMYLLKSFRRRLFAELDKTNKYWGTDENTHEPNIVFSIEEEMIQGEEQSEKQREIVNGLQKLTLKQREVIYYKFNCGFDYNQICELMNVSYSTARQLVSRAVVVLRNHMKTKNFLLFLFLRRRFL